MLATDLRLLACPGCGGDLKTSGSGTIDCLSCRHVFSCENGIPGLFWPNAWDGKKDVTETIKAFYEKTPFPDYEDLDSAASLRQKAEKGIFARLLDEQISPGSKVLEFGCGTGQLSNYLGMTWGREVWAADLCLNSLKLAQQFKQKNDIPNVWFNQMNLFKPAFRPESFDIVVCNGVLHHTSDPCLGFQSLLRLVKKGGYVIIGLYHAHSRIPTDIRRLLFKWSGDRLRFMDYRVRETKLGVKKKNAWFLDQYKNPHESKHTFGGTLSWFERCGVDFVKSIPKMRLFDAFLPDEKLFDPDAQASKIDRFLVEAGLLFTGDQEGGFFIMIGQKNKL